MNKHGIKKSDIARMLRRRKSIKILLFEKEPKSRKESLDAAKLITDFLFK